MTFGTTRVPFRRSLARHVFPEHTSEFYGRKHTWRSPRSLCLGCPPMSTSSNICWCARKSWMQSKATKVHNISRSLDLLLRHINQIAVLSARKSVLSASEEGEACRTSQVCWWSFLTVTALLMRSSFLHAKRLTSIATWRFCNVSGSKFAEIIQNDYASTHDSKKSVPAAFPDRWTRCIYSEAGNSEGDDQEQR